MPKGQYKRKPKKSVKKRVYKSRKIAAAEFAAPFAEDDNDFVAAASTHSREKAFGYDELLHAASLLAAYMTLAAAAGPLADPIHDALRIVAKHKGR